jgi:hypothetical protein
MSSKSVSPDINTNTPRFEIVDYFDSVINQIDIDAESKIVLHEKFTDENSFNSIKQINSIRNKYLEKIKKIQGFNLNAYDRDKENCDIALDKLKKNEKTKRYQILFRKFAFYLNSKSLEHVFSRNTLGLLVVLDWFLAESDLNMLM